jgi:hypothetical protein
MTLNFRTAPGYGVAGSDGTVKRLRVFLDDPRTFDSVVVVLVTWLVLGAYVTAHAYVQQPNHIEQPSATAGQIIVNAAWLLLTVFLFAAFGLGLRAGKAWNRALPDGHTGTLAAALVFGAAWIVDDAFWAPAFGRSGLGLDVLFTPPRLVEMAAAAVVVSGPLRAAARRGETQASAVTLTSAALLLSVVTFATQFINPLIDPWAASDYEFRGQALGWVGENMGVATILVQVVLLAGTGLLLNSGFKLRLGSLTFVFTVNGVLVTITKTHYYFLPVMILTGVAADIWVAWTARRPGRPSASLCAVIGGTFATAYMAEIALLPAGTVWNASLWSGTIIAATMSSWMLGRLLRAGLPTAIEAQAPAPMPVGAPPEERWTLDPESTVRVQLVRAALDNFGTPEALGRSPLGRLPGISKGGSAAADLRAALVDVIGELAASSSPRDAEAGRLLLDYYVKKVGSHEVIMERLHLSRPTFYRRLKHGFELVADRLDELSEFASRVPVGD